MMFDSDFNWTAFDEVEENTTSAGADTDTIIFSQKDFEKFLLDYKETIKKEIKREMIMPIYRSLSSIDEKFDGAHKELKELKEKVEYMYLPEKRKRQEAARQRLQSDYYNFEEEEEN